MNYFRISLLVFFLLCFFGTYAQELNCTVTINSQQIQTTDKQIFEYMRKSIYEFMNNRKWTDGNYKNFERIECNMLIILNARPAIDRFEGTLQYQVSRPVYNTSYKSTLLNISDKTFHFNYTQSQNIEFNENTFTTNLVSLLSYYAYITIGLDRDSFSPFGGTPFFQKAQNIVTFSQPSGEPGWAQRQGADPNPRNRYWLVENLLNSSYKGIREASYIYHLKGTDNMADNPEQGRTRIIESIQKIYTVSQEYSTIYLTLVFLEAKREEIIKMLGKAGLNDKKNMVELLSEMDPTNAHRYSAIMNAR